jgi:hypothetical protein
MIWSTISKLPSQYWILPLAVSSLAQAGTLPLSAVFKTVADFRIADFPPAVVLSIPRETCSGANCPDFSIANAEFLSLDQRTLNARVYLKKSGSVLGGVPLKITAKINGNWSLISEQNARVDASATGFMSNWSFTLPQDATQIGFVLSPGSNVQESNYENNSRVFDVRIADLSFEPASVQQRAGAAANQPNREVIFTILNNGPEALAAGACTLTVALSPVGGTASVAIPALPRRAKLQKKVPYRHGQSEEARARIECLPNQGDIITGNNSQNFRLN